jgi:hypothetical protein
MNFGLSFEKKENLTSIEIENAAADSEIADNQGDIWSFVAVLPETGFVHTVHNSKRTLENATVFIGKIKEKSNQKAPLFHSDCWFYEQALIDCYSTLVEVPYSGRGRPSNPITLIDKDLCYVQVHKKRDAKGKMEKISTRIVLGHEFTVLEILDKAKRCKTINTDYVESRNGKFRKDNARLIRKTLCHSKKAVFHDAQIRLLAQIFNYTRFNYELKELEYPEAEKFQPKYKHFTPAMAENVIDRKISIKELLCTRPKVMCIN